MGWNGDDLTFFIENSHFSFLISHLFFVPLQPLLHRVMVD